MNEKRRNKIKYSIKICQNKAERLRPNLSDNKPMLNEAYNRLLIEKAVLTQDLTAKKESFVSRIIKNFRKPKKELICDYFGKA